MCWVYARACVKVGVGRMWFHHRCANEIRIRCEMRVRRQDRVPRAIIEWCEASFDPRKRHRDGVLVLRERTRRCNAVRWRQCLDRTISNHDNHGKPQADDDETVNGDDRVPELEILLDMITCTDTRTNKKTYQRTVKAFAVTSEWLFLDHSTTECFELRELGRSRRPTAEKTPWLVMGAEVMPRGYRGNGNYESNGNIAGWSAKWNATVIPRKWNFNVALRSCDGRTTLWNLIGLLVILCTFSPNPIIEHTSGSMISIMLCYRQWSYTMLQWTIRTWCRIGS